MENYGEFKDKAINTLESYLQELIDDGNESDLKKVKLMSYWMKEYCEYLKEEKTFKPEKLKRYERGDIIKVNLGYNVGSEEGGLHYAVVWDMKNSMYSKVITVIPLSSVKKDDYKPRKQEVLLGNDLYDRLCEKHAKVSIKCMEMLESDIKKHDHIKSTIFELKIEMTRLDKEYEEVQNKNKAIKLIGAKFKLIEQLNKMIEEIAVLENEMILNEKYYKLLEKTRREIEKMKKGSIALVGQITTISKLRIYDPKNSYNVLSGIKLSPNTLNKINKKFKELYLYE